MSRIAHPRRCSVVVVLLAVAFAFGVTSASGAPGRGASVGHAAKPVVRAAAAKAGAVDPKYGIPAPINGPPDAPNVFQTVYDAVQAGTQATVSRSKTTITLPPSVVLTYIRTCGKLQAYDENNKPYFQQYCCPDGSTTKGCDAASIVQTPATNKDNAPPDPDGFSIGWTRLTGPIWAASPPGSSRPYGIFPDVKVRLLAFGSVPVTATVKLSQPIGANGGVTPLQYFDLTLAATPVGTRVQGFPGVKSQTSLLIARRSLRGPVDVRLDDVRVDGRAVNVGNKCRARGASLVYNAPEGEQAPDAVASDLDGRPGEFNALDGADPGTANSAITIPAFTGCTDGARNLNRLVTALASGRSRVALKLRTGAQDCFGGDANPLGGCPAYPGYTGPIGTQPTALVRALQRMPVRSARSATATLPSALRREVPAKFR